MGWRRHRLRLSRNRLHHEVKAALLGEANLDEWDLLRKPKGMRWATYERWVAGTMLPRKCWTLISSWQWRG